MLLLLLKYKRSMQFKHPEILYFLALLILPILVHLFQLQRFKTTYFTNVEFLRRISTETRKNSQIKKWLILLTRMFTIAALIIAFAQPYYSKHTSKQKPTTLFYLDNSWSSNSKSSRGNILEVAKQNIIENIGDEQSFSLLTNTNFYNNLSSEELKNKVKSVHPEIVEADIAAVMLKIENQKKHENIFLISDFQNTKSTIFNTVKFPITLIQLKPENNHNVSVDSVYITPSSNNTISIKSILYNQGAIEKSVPVAIYNGDKLVSKQIVSIEKNTKKIVDFNIQQGSSFLGKLKINLDDAYRFDNTFYFSIPNPKKINVLAIGNTNNFLSRIFTGDEFNFTSNHPNQVNFNIIEQQQLIILNEIDSFSTSIQNSIINFLEKGGNLLIIPNEKTDIKSYNSLYTQLKIGTVQKQKVDTLKITNINFQHPLLRDVFEKKVSNFQYPKVYQTTTHKLNNSSSLLKFENNQDFLSSIQRKKSNIYIFSSALNIKNSNFINSPLIVPVLYKIGKQSFQLPHLYYRLNNKEKTIEIANEQQKNKIITIKNNKESFIPIQKSFPSKTALTIGCNPPNFDGFFWATKENDTLEALAFNANKKESLLHFLPYKKIQNKNVTKMDSVQNAIQKINRNARIHWLWQWFLIAAIVSLLIEIIILKFFKV